MTELTAVGEVLEREIPGVGLLRFEDFPAGSWLTKKGEPAKVSRRRYLLGELELDAVSSVTSTLSAEALIAWAEDRGARGAVKAERLGELADVPDDEIIGRVRALGLGASAARDEAADRGTAVHLAMHTLATTGEPPNVGDYPPEWRGWITGAVRAWMALDPEPVEGEFMVCHPSLGYAGRADLLCHVGGQLVLLDWKSGRGRIFDRAHFQTRAYQQACEPSGIEPPERALIVGVDDDGGFQLMASEATAEDWCALLHVYRARKRVNSGMAAQRALAKRVAKAAA